MQTASSGVVPVIDPVLYPVNLRYLLPIFKAVMITLAQDVALGLDSSAKDVVEEAGLVHREGEAVLRGSRGRPEGAERMPGISSCPCAEI